MSLKIIDKAIASFTTNGDKLNKQGHLIAMLIIRHANVHGDCSRALALVKAMPASMRRTMLIAWFAKYTPIVVKLAGDKGEDAFGFSAKYQKLVGADAKAAAWDIDGADAEPFYMLAERVPEDKPFDLAAAIKAVQALTNRISKAKTDGKVPANDIAKVDELVAKLAKVA